MILFFLIISSVVLFNKHCKAKKVEVIAQTRVGGLPPISKHREELKLRGESSIFNELRGVFEVKGSPTYEYLNILLKLSHISEGDIFCSIFLRFPNILHATDFLCFGFMDCKLI